MARTLMTVSNTFILLLKIKDKIERIVVIITVPFEATVTRFLSISSKEIGFLSLKIITQQKQKEHFTYWYT